MVHCVQWLLFVVENDLQVFPFWYDYIYYFISCMFLCLCQILGTEGIKHSGCLRVRLSVCL